MGRFIILVLLVIIAIWLLRRALRPPEPGPEEPLRRPVVPEDEPGELVRCAHCGVYLPRSESRAAAGALYCSEEHARIGSEER
jgi:uncharacterized protein